MSVAVLFDGTCDVLLLLNFLQEGCVNLNPSLRTLKTLKVELEASHLFLPPQQCGCSFCGKV